MRLVDYCRKSKKEIENLIFTLDAEDVWTFSRHFSFLKGQHELLTLIEYMALEGDFNDNED